MFGQRDLGGSGNGIAHQNDAAAHQHQRDGRRAGLHAVHAFGNDSMDGGDAPVDGSGRQMAHQGAVAQIGVAGGHGQIRGGQGLAAEH